MKHLALIVIMSLAGCVATYSIQSKPPGVDVYDGDKKIGVTPLEIAAKDISAKNAGGILLRMEKKGYKNLWLWMPADAYAYDIAVNINPLYLSAGRNKSDITSDDSDRLELYRVSDLLLDTQTNLFLGKKIDENILRGILETNPTFGSIHYLNALNQLSQKKVDQAQIYLKDAIRYSPGEDDFMELYNEIVGSLRKKK